MGDHRAILHVDMDAFYASVEQLDRPEYRGRPVIVGADPKGGRGRGVVAACSYEARVYGIHSAMPIGHAWRRCPQGVYLRPRMDRYARASRRVFAILGRFSDLVEPLSVDEAFLDVTGSTRLFGAAAEIGRRIKEAIRSEVGLVASVGVAPSKFVAKVASDLDKPDGFVVVEPGQVESFLAPLPLSRLWGVGPGLEARLRRLGLQTVGDLARWRREDAVAALGKRGGELWALARGIDARPVVPEGEAKSLGAETTFPEDVADPEVVGRTLLALSERVASRLRKRGVVAAAVVLKLRTEGYHTVTRSLQLETPTDLAEDLYGAAKALLDRLPWRGHRVRLVGVTAARLRGAGEAGRQLALFGAGGSDRRGRLARGVDRIRERYGAGAITRAALIRSKKP
ncbi:MAG: DNA polymerase IV [Deferrisomatales bacterium]